MYFQSGANGDHRTPGVLGTVDYYYRKLNAILGAYLLPVLGVLFFAGTYLSSIDINDVTGYILPYISYIWLATLAVLTAFFAILAYKYIGSRRFKRAVAIGLAALGMIMTVGILNVFGIVPLSITATPGSTFTCPSGFICQLSFSTYLPGMTSGPLAPAGAANYTGTFTAPSVIPISNAKIISIQVTEFFSGIQMSSPGIVVSTTTFTESGLPPGTSWTVEYDGLNSGSTTSTISFTGSVGIGASYSYYIYTVGLNSGVYVPAPSYGSVMEGSSTAITFSEEASPSGTGISSGPGSSSSTTTTSTSPTITGTISGTLSTSINFLSYLGFAITGYFHV